jgi:hypothetical protein
VAGSRLDATVETGELPWMPRWHSIWYAWTAPTYGYLSFDATGAWVWAFSGDGFGSLTQLSNGLGHGFIHVEPGVTYHFALDDWNDADATQLNWSLDEVPAPPPNDDWANAEALTGTAGTVHLDTLGATDQTCDPDLQGSRNVWYRWTATADGELTIADTTYRGTVVGLYTGAPCAFTVLVRTGGDPAHAAVVAGQTYWIAVGTWGGHGPKSFSWSFALVDRPANDLFANAQDVGPSYSGTIYGSTAHATAEAGENPIWGHSVWYSWTPAETGAATVHVFEAESRGRVYTGDSLASLTQVAKPNRSFQARAGTRYVIQIDSNETPFSFQWLLEPDRPPVNDDFANAEPAYDASGRISATNRLATFEKGEPDHGGKSHASVWFA